MNEGQQAGNETLHHTMFVYSKPGNKKESQRIPFHRNPKPPLYQSRVAEMKKNLKATPVKRGVIRTAPKHIQWHVETKPKATIKMKHETVDTTSTSFGNDDLLAFPDDLELSFWSGQLNTTNQLELSTSSAVPDIDTSTHQDNTETQQFYELPTTPSKAIEKPRKRTYRDYPDYTCKKPFYGKNKFTL